MNPKGTFILTQENVAGVFLGAHPSTIIEDEHGFIVSDFKHTYPKEMRIYCTRNFYASCTGSGISKDLEDYFYPLDKTVEYLARHFETNLESRLKDFEAQYAVIHYSPKAQAFTLDRIIEGCIHLMLCRILVPSDEAERMFEDGVVAGFRPQYLDIATHFLSRKNCKYLYFTAQPDNILNLNTTTDFIADIPDKWRR